MSVAPQLEPYRSAELDEGEHLPEVRMSFGDHLEELRTRLIRALMGITLATVVAFLFGEQLILLTLRPLLVVQAAHGFQPQLQSISPATTFLVYMKLSILAGLLGGMPWLLYQGWQFVAAGLYPRERTFARKLILPSMFLFAIGVLFLYFLVLPMMLQFFITFNRAFPVPDLTPASFQRWLLPHAPEPSSLQSETMPRERIPIVSSDPANPAVGEVWYNATTRRMVIHAPEGLRSFATEPGPGGTVIQSHFALDYYVSFVLTMALAFGVAFETPVVVFFLAWAGLVSTESMRKGRRFVILGAVVAAAILTPTPDIIGQLLLAGPIYLLFELGVLIARWHAARA